MPPYEVVFARCASFVLPARLRALFVYMPADGYDPSNYLGQDGLNRAHARPIGLTATHSRLHGRPLHLPLASKRERPNDTAQRNTDERRLPTFS
jgi:hypothetical protein